LTLNVEEEEVEEEEALYKERRMRLNVFAQKYCLVWYNYPPLSSVSSK
jgi:hypothetical protein